MRIKKRPRVEKCVFTLNDDGTTKEIEEFYEGGEQGETVAQPGNDEDDEPCAGCIYSFKSPDLSKKPSVMDQLYKIYSENKYICQTTLAKMISDAYDTLVFLPLMKQNAQPPPPPWTPAQVLKHLQSHQLDREFTMVNDVRDVEQVEKQVKDRLREAHDPEDVILFIKLKSLKRVLLQNNNNNTI